MSMITGCPACGTLFRVVPDQLKISEGWVRCGHCGEVFDASASLRPEASSAGQPMPEAAAAPAPVDEPAGGDEAVPSRVDAPAAHPIEVGPPGIAPVEVPTERIDPVAVAPLFLRAESEPAAPAAPGTPDSQFPASHGFADAEFGHDALTPDEEDALVRPVPARQKAADPGEADAAPLSRPFAHSAAQPLDDAYPDDLSFVQQARRHAFWRRPAVRMLMLVAVLLLAGLLVAQYALHDRNRLAAQHPELRPWLARLCVPAGCTLGPPQRIESVVIDNSGFTRLRPDTFRLSVSLRNPSELPVAMPALQLTLTDSQERTVVQRVFMPAELGATSDSIAPASEFAASLVLAASGTAAGRIAGYRLLAFYP